MSLPARLYPGYLSIYGAKSVNGIVPSGGFQFGRVNQIYDSIPDTVSINQSVMFRSIDSIIVTYSGIQYFILPENKIILIEEILT